MKSIFFGLVVLCLFPFCKKETIGNDSENFLRLKLEFNPNQERLNNLGQPAAMPSEHAGQTPDFRGMSVHFIELVPTKFTPYKSGAAIYSGAEVDANNPNPHGFTKAIDFENALIMEEGEVFLEVPMKDIPAGEYEHVRVSVSYQNYDVKFNLKEVPVIGDVDNQSGTVTSFLGYNVFLKNVKVREQEVAVNDFKLQGFWAFETDLSSPWSDYNQVSSGQAPSGATTVVNPFPESPIPPGSCVVSGSLDQTISISTEQSEDVDLTLSFSANDSFEWIDLNNNGEWDLNASNPNQSEKVVDMGVRGLIGKVE